jgi:protein-tyrosine phosphatase
MDPRQLAAVRAIAPQARGKTFLLGRWIDDAEVPDPYGKPRSAFEHAYRMIDTAVDSWLSRF